MLKKSSGPLVRMDRAMAETSDAQMDYESLLGELEEIAVRVLAEQNIPSNIVSMQSLDDDLQEYSERGIIAMHAYVSIRLLKGWAADAVFHDEASANTFYRVAYHAANAATHAALIGPMVTSFRSREVEAFLKRKKKKEAALAAAEDQASRIRSALTQLWAAGKRYPALDPWSNAVCALDPTLAPAKGVNNDVLNRRVSTEGKALFSPTFPK